VLRKKVAWTWWRARIARAGPSLRPSSNWIVTTVCAACTGAANASTATTATAYAIAAHLRAVPVTTGFLLVELASKGL
jgi:hypothetical protein